MTAPPSMTVTATAAQILGNLVAGTDLSETALYNVPVTFVSNVAADQVVLWENRIEKLPPVVAHFAPDGTLKRNGDPVKLLANDSGLNVTGLQWTCFINGTEEFTFNAGVDGEVIDLSEVVNTPNTSVVALTTVPLTGIQGSSVIGRQIVAAADQAAEWAILGNVPTGNLPAPPTWSTIAGKPAVVAAGPDQATARAAISTMSATEIATAITTAINGLINGAPGALDTLKELADALGDDQNFATTIANQIATINASLALRIAKGELVYNVKDYGAKGDAISTTCNVVNGGTSLARTSGGFVNADVGKTVVVKGAGATRSTAGGNGTIASGATTFTTTTNANFTAADVRSVIVIPGAGVAGAALTAIITNVKSASNVTIDTAASTSVTTATATVTPFLLTTIASVNSGTGVATLSAAAGRTVTGASVLYGTDDTAAFNVAVSACAASLSGVGIVFCPASKYLTTGAIEVSDYIRFTGAGRGVTRIYKATTAANLTAGYAAIHCQRTSTTALVDFTLEHLTIDGAYTQQGTSYAVSNKGVQTEYVTGCTYQHLTVRGCLATGIAADWMTGGTVIHDCHSINNGAGTYTISQGGGGSGFGIGTGNVAAMDCTISDCYASGNGNYGIFFESENGSLSTGIKVINCTAANNGVSGFSDCGGDGSIFADCVAYGNNFEGFTNDSGSVTQAKPGQNTLWSNCVSHNNLRNGFGYNPTAGGIGSVYQPNAVGGVSWKNCKSYRNAFRGFDILTNTGIIDGLEWDNCESYQNGSSGLGLNGSGTVKNVIINGGAYYHNGTTSGTDLFGIRVNCNATNVTIRGTKAYDTAATATQTYGLVFTAGFTITNLVVEGNDFQNNVTGAILFGATRVGTQVIRGNAGYSLTPTIVVGAAAGTSPAVSVVGDDFSGTIFITVGTAPTVGTLATVTMSSIYQTSPNVVITPGDAASAVGGLYVVPATGAFALKCVAMPDVADTYTIYYRVIGS
jgi:hypothetical protein